ncbi:MAG: SIS domain-containing protein, partial [Chthoniobacterales bacterium]
MNQPNDNLQESIREACRTFEALAELAGSVTEVVEAVVACLGGGHKLLACGNGGSAADAADFTTEFGCRFLADRRSYPALNLAQGGSLISAIGND